MRSVLRRIITGVWRPVATVVVVLATAGSALGATWQYRVPFERGPDKRGRPQQPGDVLLWLPPQSQTIRAVLLCGRLRIESELIVDPHIRRTCRENDIAIVYFTPHISGVFHYWEQGNRDGERLLRALEDLAKRSGHDELRRVPWITVGHSTSGIFARNVAYWKPKRTAGVIHLKSGNFHQREHLPPSGSLSGVPLVAINGQFETYGPEGGLRAEFGRETQWVFVLKDIHRFRERDDNELMSLLVHPGADHFQGSPELGEFVSLFLRKTQQYRVPKELPEGKEPIACLPLAAEQGWLVDHDLYNPRHAPAPYADFTGDRSKALWHYDQETAEAAGAFYHNLGQHQVLSNPECVWLEEGDGWTFRARAEFLDTMPEKYGGRFGGKHVGHSRKPFVYRARRGEPVRQVGKDRFRLLRPARRVHVAAYHPGDDSFRATIRWGSIEMPRLKHAEKQTVHFPPIGDLRADSRPRPLKLTASSGLPVYVEVDFGPVVVENGRLQVSEIPTRAEYPIPCKLTAYQIGRRTEPSVAAAEPVSVVFDIVDGVAATLSPANNQRRQSKDPNRGRVR